MSTRRKTVNPCLLSVFLDWQAYTKKVGLFQTLSQICLHQWSFINYKRSRNLFKSCLIRFVLIWTKESLKNLKESRSSSVYFYCFESVAYYKVIRMSTRRKTVNPCLLSVFLDWQAYTKKVGLFQTLSQICLHQWSFINYKRTRYLVKSCLIRFVLFWTKENLKNLKEIMYKQF